MKRINPLHTIEFLVDQMRSSGCYPDIERCTGRTTAIALRTIASALERPHEVVHFRDHHDTVAASRDLAHMIVGMVAAIGLKHLHVNTHECKIVFGEVPR